MNNELITLENRSIVQVSGYDSIEFLQSIITIDLLNNENTELKASCLLSPQGKLLNQFFIKKEENQFLLDLHKNSFQEFIKKLQLYKLNANVFFEERKDLEVVICLNEKLENSFLDPRHKDLGWRLMREKNHNCFKSNNYEKRKIELGIVEEGEDFLSGEFFPIELNLDYQNSISFKKGCFIGQEVTSRMHRKGKPKKRIFSISMSEENQPGDDISFESKKIGSIIKALGVKAVAIIRTDIFSKIKKEKITVNINDKETQISIHIPHFLENDI